MFNQNNIPVIPAKIETSPADINGSSGVVLTVHVTCIPGTSQIQVGDLASRPRKTMPYPGLPDCSSYGPKIDMDQRVAPVLES